MSESTRPPWLKVRLPGLGQYYDVRKQLAHLEVHSVCEEARCPNAAECWGSGTATFMILGDLCTRACRFCAVKSGRPSGPPPTDEPERVAQAAAALGLRYAVVTSVDRDDLPDGGAAHFARTVAAIKARCPETVVELLTPDFGGDRQALTTVGRSGAEVVGHNLETTASLTPQVRDRRCSYQLSLAALSALRQLDPRLLVKSSLLLGIGETDEELLQALTDLRQAGVDWVTLGQYLRPTRKHLPVQRFVEPARFDALAAEAHRLGFALVTAGPLVRSSYRAAEAYAAQLVAKRRASAPALDTSR